MALQPRKVIQYHLWYSEPLKYDLEGFWSRRITGEQELIYEVEV